MAELELPDPLFRNAVELIHRGDVSALTDLLAAHPALVRERLDYGEGYFSRPYLLWFVAENPVRTAQLPANIVDVSRAILRAAERYAMDTLAAQRDYALGLVCSARVPRECGVQIPLIDLLVDAGADPDAALLSALAHRESAAVERLLARGATLTLAAAAGTGRVTDVARLAATASPGDRQLALAAAALYGDPISLAMLIAAGVDLNAHAPDGFHAHATPLHHAVDSGSREAVKVLVEGGASLRTRDRLYDGTPLDWAKHLGRAEVAAYLRQKSAE